MATVVEGKVKEFGEAPYQHDEKNQQSYFVRLDTSSGERELWALGLKDVIANKNIKVGEQIAFADLGIQEGSRRRIWDAERYQPEIEHTNSIEQSVAQDKVIDVDDKAPANDYRKSKYVAIDEDELELPTSVKANYIAKVQNRYFSSEKINFYEKDSDDTTIAFEDRDKSLNTSREDAKTIKAMLDVADSKGWSSINIKGTESFKREVWLEAHLRGIETQGYKPTEKDLVELEKRKAERSNNQVIGNEERSRELNSQQQELPAQKTDKAKEDVSNSVVTETQLDKESTEISLDTERQYADFEFIPEREDYDLDFEYLSESMMRHEALIRGDNGRDVDPADPRISTTHKEEIEREALVRANEFDAGRDIDPDPNTEVAAEVEQFHDNLAVPSGSNMSHEKAMQKVEAAFDRKINVSQRNEIKELEKKLPNDQKIAVEGWRRIVDERYHNDSAMREQKHEALNAKLPAIAAGEIKLPVPTVDVQERIEIQTRDKGSQDRTR